MAERRKTETTSELEKRGQDINRRLARAYPDARCSLNFRSPFELLAATILSAQCTDERVNQVVPALFAVLPGPREMAAAPPEQIEELIRTTGFFRNKAKSLKGMAAALLEKHGGEVPATLDELVRLPGVGRKTANVVLGNCFDVPGITVDTHVGRVSLRLGLTKQEDPVKVERDLMRLIPQKEWTNFCHRVIWHGRQVCQARKPACEHCVINTLCTYFARHRSGPK